MRPAAWALAIALSASGMAEAHDFWIQPSRFTAAPGEAVGLELRVGHAGESERSSLPRRRIRRFEVVGVEGRGEALPAETLTLTGQGLHVAVLETDNEAYSQLPAGQFNAHLELEGLTPAIVERRRTGRADARGSERYGPRAKALILAGPAGAASPEEATRPVGLSLEIVPAINPYVLQGEAKLRLVVLHEGRPLEGALLKLKDLDRPGVQLAALRTDAAGAATFTLPPNGRWLATTVWTRPLAKDAPADFETTFASVTFARE